MFAVLSHHRRIAGFFFLIGFVALLSVTFVAPNQVNAQDAVSPGLGTAASFAVLANTTVTNTGPSVVNGDLGVSGGTAVTGFPPGVVLLPGTIHAGDAAAIAAQTDATAAYLDLQSQGCTTTLTNPELSGLTLTPGVYCFETDHAQLNGSLTLSSAPGGVFVFKTRSTLITGSNASVTVTGGASTCDVWWQVGSSATLGTNTSFVGNILALASITLTTGADVVGRTLAQTAAVTLDSNMVDASNCSGLAPTAGLSLTKDDGGARVWPGEVITYALSYQNTGSIALDNVTLSDTVPANTTFNAGSSAAGWVCDEGNCTLNVGTVQPGAGGSSAFAVSVNDGTDSNIGNTASITSGDTTATASDTTTVRGQEDDDDNPTSPPPAATAPPPAATTGPVATIPGVVGTPSAQAGVLGLPNTGGAAPQATYWLTMTPGR